jgi:hypothetical protein
MYLCNYSTYSVDSLFYVLFISLFDMRLCTVRILSYHPHTSSKYEVWKEHYVINILNETT